MRRVELTIALSLALSLAGCASAPPSVGQAAPPPALSLRFLGSTDVPRPNDGPLRHLGGISGLDRDPASGRWYLLSDDRSSLAPARFYPAAIEVTATGVRVMHIDPPVTLRQPDGSAFPNAAEGGEVPDPEDIRWDPLKGRLVWSSEGDRGRNLQPFVRWSLPDGRSGGELPLPANLRVHADREYGARDNLTFEGLAFTPDGASLWVSMEGPLYQDGPVPTPEHGAHVRFTRLDREGHVLAQHAYPVDAVPLPPASGLRCDNGVSEILATGPDTLLVVERSGREVTRGVFRFSVRLYEASAVGATDVQAVESLRSASFVPMRKRLVLDLAAAGIDADNAEGAAWGPPLPNGHRTLLLVSDDNFDLHQATRLTAFEVLP